MSSIELTAPPAPDPVYPVPGEPGREPDIPPEPIPREPDPIVPPDPGPEVPPVPEPT